MEDFMYCDAADFKQKYIDLTYTPDSLIALSTDIIKKILVVQSWYAILSQDCD
jgi:hypothetical protein